MVSDRLYVYVCGSGRGGIAIKKKGTFTQYPGGGPCSYQMFRPPVEWEKGLQVVISQEKWKFCDKE